MINCLMLAILKLGFAQGSAPEGQIERIPDSESPVAVISASPQSTIVKKDKRQLYPGGRDEEDLVVQDQLVKPVRKAVLPELVAPAEQPEE